MIHTRGIPVLGIPPYSPDTNPMENLLAMMARQVELHSCETIEKLQDVIADVQHAVTTNRLVACLLSIYLSSRFC